MDFVKVCWILFLPVIAASTSYPKIINGTAASIDYTRHQVSIRLKANEIIFGTGHICGGSLIKPTVVLSAAHCFFDDMTGKFQSARYYFVVMGTLDRFEKNENTISLDITHIVHGDFVRSTYTNDIAIVFLDGTVPASNPAINVIPLNREVIPAGTICQVTGWGKTETGLLSEILLTIDVPILDRKTCSTNYGESTIKDGMICAGYMDGEKDASNGDSGGPLVSNNKLIGIVSFGINNSSLTGYPGVYTDVRYYVNWIDDTIKRSSASSKSLSYFIVLLVFLSYLNFPLFKQTAYDSIIKPKIINGTAANETENKYQVSIHLKERDFYFGSGHVCGGSLIKPSIVITAAHCIYNEPQKVMRTANEFLVSMGSVDRFDRINSTTFEVLELYYKETFNTTTYVDDIAIFILNGQVSEKFKNIKPIDINWDNVTDDTMCQVSGWGITGEGITSDILMIVNVPIINQTICEKNYQGSVKEGMICAGYMNGTADACDGDSGGPLVCNNKLTAIVSFGVGCAVKDFPGVYTDLKYHYKWIQNVTDSFENLKSSALNIKVSHFGLLFVILVLFIT
ncbi:transmembrane protease serine 9-like, partial [Episyrphus balteatus]|uniref:transmembrane protease serine 9-like n=1 Tax=Episyrphus balteatus TaxID=286459 RepID=UPI00248597FB